MSGQLERRSQVPEPLLERLSEYLFADPSVAQSGVANSARATSDKLNDARGIRLTPEEAVSRGERIAEDYYKPDADLTDDQFEKRYGMSRVAAEPVIRQFVAHRAAKAQRYA